MNVYDHQSKQSARLSKSKKMSKSTEDTNKLVENESKTKLATLNDQKLDKKETIEMPIKISSLNAMKKERQQKNAEETGQKKPTELRPTNLDYVQTDENETLQDISTSFSEEKFDSLPEQMNSETIKKQFHEAFKSMSVVNEEISDQDYSSSNEDNKTEVEKVPIKTTFQQVNQMTKTLNAIQTDDKKKEDLLKQSDHIVKKDSVDKIEDKKTDKDDIEKLTVKTSFQQVNQMNKSVNALKLDDDKKEDKIDGEKENKLNVQITFQQVNQMSKTVKAFNQDMEDSKIDIAQQSDEEKKETTNLINANNRIEAEDLLIDGKINQKTDEKLFDENNEILEELGDIIITNVTNVQKILTTNYMKKEQSEMINHGWVVVDIIKEIDEKEDEIQKEEIKKSEIHTQNSKDDSDKTKLKDSLNKNEFEKQDLAEKQDLVKKQESKEIIKKQDTEDNFKKQDSKESIKKHESKENFDKIGSKDTIVKKDQLVKKIKKEETIKKIENKSLEKAKSEDSSDQLKKSKKSSSVSSSCSSLSNLDSKKESKIAKLSKQKNVKLPSTSSSSTTSTPSKKSVSSKSSTSSTNSIKSSPTKKSKTFILQSTIEEKQDNQQLKDKKFVGIETQKSDILDKTIIFDEDKIKISKAEELDGEVTLDDKIDRLEKTIDKKSRKASIVSFPGVISLDVEKECERKKYAKTPIKQLSTEEKLNDEELSVPNYDNNDEDSSPQSLNEEINKEQIRKEKNDLIENIDKKLREENIKKIKEIEEITVRKLIEEEQKKISENQFVKNEQNIEESVKKELAQSTDSELKKLVDSKESKKVSSANKKLKEHQKGLSKEDKIAKKPEKKSIDSEGDKKEDKLAKADSRAEIIYKKSSIEVEDVSERTAYIENMLRTSGYTERIIEKANEFISGKEDDDKNKEDGIVEEVCVKLVKKKSKDYHNGKDVTNQQLTDSNKETAKKSNAKKETKAETKTTGNQNKSEKSTVQQPANRSTEKPAIFTNQLKKSTSLSKIPTFQASKVKKVEISSKFLNKQEDDQNKMTSSNIDQSSFKRACLKPLQTKSEPIEQAINRPVFKRKKSDLPPKHPIQVNTDHIKKKWSEIKTNEKDKLNHQQQYYSRLRRTTSNPVISNSFDLIYEVNKMPQWAKTGVENQNKNASQRSNTTSIITQTKRILEKVEKKEIEEVTTRTIINDEEFTKTSREETSKTHRSETEETESSISGKQCAICKKIIIPITEDMKFCKRDLRKMLSDSALEIKTCRC